MDKTVSVIGLGYVGLSTAVLFANKGIRVFGVELDEKKIERIKCGDSIFLRT